MNSLIPDYLQSLQELHVGLEKAVSDLPPAALSWQPGPEMNSIGVLITHTTGAQRFWIGDMVQQTPSGRVRAAEFIAPSFTSDSLMQLLRDTLTYSKSVLQTLTLADLDREIFSSRHGRSFRVAWAILHALEHTALHLGHVEITRQLWEQKQSSLQQDL